MKVLLLFLTLLSSSILFGQNQDSVDLDSIQARIALFNDSITKIIEKYEVDSIDFIAVRSNRSYGPNCRFTIRKDSCTRMFILYLGESELIEYIHCATIASRVPNEKPRPCPKELDAMYYELTYYENYFIKSKPDYTDFDPSKITFLGSVDGRYLHEVVDVDYFSTHHPGMFYATFSLYF